MKRLLLIASMLNLLSGFNFAIAEPGFKPNCIPHRVQISTPADRSSADCEAAGGRDDGACESAKKFLTSRSRLDALHSLPATTLNYASRSGEWKENGKQFELEIFSDKFTLVQTGQAGSYIVSGPCL